VSDQQVTAPPGDVAVPPQLVEAMARALVAALAPPSQPVASGAGEAADFLTAGQFARRLGISRETVRRLAIAKVLPCTVVCRGARKTTRRFPRRFADEFAASGLDLAELAEFAARRRARASGAEG
jgi:excisionase family DNA binding protein